MKKLQFYIMVSFILSFTNMYSNDYLIEIDRFFVSQMQNKKSIPLSTIQNLVRIQNEFYKLNKYIDTTSNIEDKSFAYYIQGFAYSIFDLTDFALESQLKIKDTKDDNFNYKWKKDLADTYQELKMYNESYKLREDIFKNYVKYHRNKDTVMYYYSLFYVKDYKKLIGVDFEKFINENNKEFLRYKYFAYGLSGNYIESKKFLKDNKSICNDYNSEIKNIEERGDSLYWSEMSGFLFSSESNLNEINQNIKANTDIFRNSKYYLTYWFYEVYQHYGANILTKKYDYQKPVLDENVKFSFIIIEGIPLLYFQSPNDNNIDKTKSNLNDFKKMIHWQSSFDSKMDLKNEIIYFLSDNKYHFIVTHTDEQREIIKNKYKDYDWDKL